METSDYPNGCPSYSPDARGLTKGLSYLTDELLFLVRHNEHGFSGYEPPAEQLQHLPSLESRTDCGENYRLTVSKPHAIVPFLSNNAPDSASADWASRRASQRHLFNLFFHRVLLLGANPLQGFQEPSPNSPLNSTLRILLLVI